MWAVTLFFLLLQTCYTCENAKSDYVNKNLKNVLKYIFQSQVDCCLPTSLLLLLLLLLPANQPTFTSEAEERRADWLTLLPQGRRKIKKTIVPVCCCWNQPEDLIRLFSCRQFKLKIFFLILICFNFAIIKNNKLKK